MTTIKLSKKRQVALRAVEAGKKPASTLFERLIRKGRPVAIEEIQGLVVARKLMEGGKL